MAAARIRASSRAIPTSRFHAGVSNLLQFVGLSLVVIVTPGQDTALTIRNSLRGGSRAGVRTAIGVSAGQATWTLVTAAGIGVILASSEGFFGVLRLLGVGYLLYLGSQSLLAAVRGSSAVSVRSAVVARDALPASAVSQGLISNLSNPKMLAFFTSLLPQFGDSFAGLLSLGLGFSLMTMVWLTAYALAVASLAKFLLRPAIHRSLEALTGACLIGFGVQAWMRP